MTTLFTPAGRALRPLWPHQERALEALRRSLTSGHKRPMVQMPTGTGKTLLAAHIIRMALYKGKRVAFVVPVLNLINQTIERFEAEGIDTIGVLQGQRELTDLDAPVQIISAQTLARRKRPVVDLVIVDEAHQLIRENFPLDEGLSRPIHRPLSNALGARTREILTMTSSRRSQRRP